MQAPMIVEAFDPANDVEPSLGAGFVAELIDAFDFQRLEEALHRGIVPAVGLAAHRLQHPEIHPPSSESYQHSDVRETGTGSPKMPSEPSYEPISSWR
jgi:hypothetical protein